MRAIETMEKYLYIETFGCQMNEHDSGKMVALLAARDYRLTDDPEKADLILVNTCAVRGKAEQKFRSTLGRYRTLKERKPGLIIGVAGCVAQVQGKAILNRVAHVDLVIGTHHLLELPGLLEEVAAGGRVAATDFTPDLHDRFNAHLIPHAYVPTKAYVTVMEGCDLFCTFCIVPYTRGRELSRPADEIVDEVRRLARQGVTEVTLLGQTVNAYGRRGGGVGFHDLLARIDEVPGIARIRFTSSHPLYVTGGLIEAYRNLKHLCPHLHLPVQSGSDAVLARMRRRHTRAQYLDIVRRVRLARSDVAVTTDLIVGFPGETEEDFKQTLRLMREVQFSDIYAFVYSERPETKAAGFTDRVPEPVRRERLARVLEAQREINLAQNRTCVGGVLDVLVEGRSKTDHGKLTGRTPHHRIVNFRGDEGDIGRIVAVRILEASSHSLSGEALSQCPESEIR
jgi:tRNA-2-methylthio-N6-dimethylallyladenosine synthase